MIRICIVGFLVLGGCGGEEPAVPEFRATKNIPFAIQASDLIESTDVDKQNRWSVLKSPPGATSTLSDKAGEQIIFKTQTSGHFELAMSFGLGQNVATFPFTIDVENTAPTVVAQGNTFVIVGMPIPLRVADSADLNEDELNFEWRVTSAPDSSSILDSLVSGSFVPDVVGNYRIQLDAIDTEGARGVSSFQVTATPNFAVEEIPVSGSFDGLEFANGTLLYASRDSVALKVGDSAMREVAIPQGVGSLEQYLLHRDGGIAVVSTRSSSVHYIHVIDVALGEVINTIDFDGFSNYPFPIAFASENELYVSLQSKIWVYDLSTGAGNQLLQTSVSQPVFDESQSAFYTDSIRKWVFDQGVLVEANSIQPTDRVGRKHLSSARKELIDLNFGNIYTVSSDLGQDLVWNGAFPGSIGSIVNPDFQNWRVTLEEEGDVYPVPIEYGSSINQRSPLVISPLVYDGRLREIDKIHGIAEGRNPNEVYMVFDIGQKTMLGVFPVNVN